MGWAILNGIIGFMWYWVGRLQTTKRYNEAIFKAYRDQTWRDQNNV